MTARAWNACAGFDCRDACKWARVCMADESAKLMDEATDPATTNAPAWPWAPAALTAAPSEEVQS